jgi:hypothetical protein
MKREADRLALVLFARAPREVLHAAKDRHTALLAQ